MSLSETNSVLVIVGMIAVVGTMILCVIVAAISGTQRRDVEMEEVLGRIEQLERRASSERQRPKGRPDTKRTTRPVTIEDRNRRFREHFDESG